jgi:zinc protease
MEMRLARWRIRRIPTLVVVAAVGCVSAEEVAHDQTVVGPAPSRVEPGVGATVTVGERLRVGPKIRETRRADLVVEVLPNGTCLAVKGAATPGVVSVQFWVGAGSATEGPWTGQGISHFVEHMIFEGTVREPGRGFDLLVRSNGGVHNGYTSLERTVYHVTVPKDGYLPVLDGLVKLVREAGIPEERFAKERDVVLQEIREGEDDPGRLANRLLAETVYRVHPYRHRIAGRIEEFSKLTHADLVEYFESRYVPGNEIVVIAGDLVVEEALAAAGPLLTEVEPEPLPDLSRPEEPEQASPRFAEVRHPRARNARVMFAWRTVDLLHPDLFALDVLAMILGEGRACRLHRALREDTDLALSVGAYSWTPRDPGYLGIWAVCEDDRVGELPAAVAREIERVRKQPVDETELDRARSQVAAGLVFRQQTAEGAARDLASDLMFTGDPDFSRRYLDGVRGVTAEDVLEVARTYLAPGRMSVTAFRPTLAEGDEEAESVEGVALSAWGMPEGKVLVTDMTALAQARLGREFGVKSRAPVTERRNAEGRAVAGRAKPVVSEIPGGGTLVLIRDPSLPMVSVSATLLAGLRLEPEGRAGVSEMLAKLMEKGTESHSAEELAVMIEGRGGAFNVLSGRNSLSVRADMLSEDLQTALDFAAEMLAEPKLDPDDVEKVRAEQLAAVRARGERAWSVAMEAMQSALYRGHPYRYPETGTEESVSSISRGDLVEFHGKTAVRGNLVLAVAGDFVPARVEELAANAFARLLDVDPDYVAPAAADFPEGRVRVERDLPGSRSSVIAWGFPGPVMGTPEAHALALAAEAMDGMSGRLWTAVRGEEGLAYAVGAFSSPQVDPGMFVLYVATRPDWEEKALSLLREELHRLLDEPPVGEELERAKASLSGEDAIGLQSRGAMSMRAALYERYGLGAGAAFDYGERLEAVTAEDLARVCRNYLDPDGGVVAVVRPGESKGKP